MSNLSNYITQFLDFYNIDNYKSNLTPEEQNKLENLLLDNYSVLKDKNINEMYLPLSKQTIFKILENNMSEYFCLITKQDFSTFTESEVRQILSYIKQSTHLDKLCNSLLPKFKNIWLELISNISILSFAQIEKFIKYYPNEFELIHLKIQPDHLYRLPFFVWKNKLSEEYIYKYQNKLISLFAPVLRNVSKITNYDKLFATFPGNKNSINTEKKYRGD